MLFPVLQRLSSSSAKFQVRLLHAVYLIFYLQKHLAIAMLFGIFTRMVTVKGLGNKV